MLSSSDMVEKDNLSVLITFDFHSLGSITWWILVGVHIDHLSVPLVSEDQSSVRVGVYSEVGRVVEGGVLSIPVKET